MRSQDTLLKKDESPEKRTSAASSSSKNGVSLVDNRALQTKSNKTGLPNQLKTGIENLSGHSLDDVSVHYNSPKPAQLQALAYAQGNQIHIAPGQEKHLPHEAWHVVQQKQGRVQPTLQMKQGVAVNNDKGLEHEADVMGQKAIGAGSLQMKAGLQQSTTNSTTVQRAVGFEFETGWLVNKRVIDPSNDEDTGIIEVPLKKKDKIGNKTFTGFKMEADEAAGGMSEIEFIVHPAVEETIPNLSKLDGIMGDMLAFCGRLLTYKGSDNFRLFGATNTAGDNDYVVHPPKGKGNNLEAGPQATLGLDIAKIPEFLAKANLYNNEAAPVAVSNTPKQQGLLHLISNYLNAGIGNAPVNYPKRIADTILARTNFAKLFSLIEQPRIIYYKAHRDEWVKDVLNFAEIALEKKGDDIISRKIVDDKDTDAHTHLRQQLFLDEQEMRDLNNRIGQTDDEIRTAQEKLSHLSILDMFEKKKLNTQIENLKVARTHLIEEKVTLAHAINDKTQQKRLLEKGTGLSIERWLLGMLDGQDHLASIKDAESMGEFGHRTEQVGQNKEIEAAIFEYRAAQGNKMQPKDWRDFAHKIFWLALKLHGHDFQAHKLQQDAHKARSVNFWGK